MIDAPAESNSRFRRCPPTLTLFHYAPINLILNCLTGCANHDSQPNANESQTTLPWGKPSVLLEDDGEAAEEGVEGTVHYRGVDGRSKDDGFRHNKDCEVRI